MGTTCAAAWASEWGVLCRDGSSMKLLRERATTVRATNIQPRRVDYEYERASTACVFLFCEPLVGWRSVSIPERRTEVDWATEGAELLRGRYAQAQKVILVCDNLNTHTKGAFYEAFPPAEARALVRRLECRHTPKHGSGLNVAENELSAMTRQCLRGRRFGTVEEMRRFPSASLLLSQIAD